MDDSPPLHPAIRGLKSVCRCNNIKYRTIERAIRWGAHTVADVAEKTGATTGHCGGSCTPDVLLMLAEHAGVVRPCVRVPGENQGSMPATDWWVRKK
jgi:NAD(P)H-nitrite reductase large subunit